MSGCCLCTLVFVKHVCRSILRKQFITDNNGKLTRSFHSNKFRYKFCNFINKICSKLKHKSELGMITHVFCRRVLSIK